MRRESHRQRPLAVRREHHMRDAVGECKRVRDLDLGAVEREHADRVVAAIGNQRHLAGRADAQARWLLTDGDGRSQFGRARLEIDDIDFVVRHLFQRVAVLRHVDRIRHQRNRAARIDIDIDRRSNDRILQGQGGDDLGTFRIGEIDDQNRVLARRGQDGLAIIVPPDFLIVADDHERLGRCEIEGGAADENGCSQG